MYVHIRLARVRLEDAGGVRLHLGPALELELGGGSVEQGLYITKKNKAVRNDE